MFRYLLNISYMGTYFRGMQKTINVLEKETVDMKSVQGCIEYALQNFHPVNEIKTVVSSRTDTGVHALHSTVHVDLQKYDNKPYEVDKLTVALNRRFNRDNLSIKILKTELVPDTFHCRFNAKGRTYVYRLAVQTGKHRTKNETFAEFVPVDELDRCHFIHVNDFDIQRVIEGSQLFLGRHDFRTFMSTSRQKILKNPMTSVRAIDQITIRKGKSLAFRENSIRAEQQYDFWEIEVNAKSFLYKQVRRIVGALIALGTGKIDEKCIKHMLTVPSKHSWDPRIALPPPCGLYLCRVHYNQEDLIFAKELFPSVDSKNLKSIKENEQFSGTTL